MQICVRRGAVGRTRYCVLVSIRPAMKVNMQICANSPSENVNAIRRASSWKNFLIYRISILPLVANGCGVWWRSCDVDKPLCRFNVYAWGGKKFMICFATPVDATRADLPLFGGNQPQRRIGKLLHFRSLMTTSRPPGKHFRLEEKFARKLYPLGTPVGWKIGKFQFPFLRVDDIGWVLFRIHNRRVQSTL